MPLYGSETYPVVAAVPAVYAVTRTRGWRLLMARLSRRGGWRSTPPANRATDRRRR
jgi:hypothetical protein